MALEIINLRYVDEVWIVPCGDRQDKVVDVDRFSRYKMCEIMLNEMFNPSIPIKSPIYIKIRCVNIHK